MDILSIIRQIEQQMKEQDSIYHNAAVKYGLSDTAMWVLYEVYISECPVTQQELSKCCFFAKQTVNTAVASLVKKGYAMLENAERSGRKKRIHLTEQGRELAKMTIEPLMDAECRAFAALDENELKAYLDMTCRLTAALRIEIEKLEGV